MTLPDGAETTPDDPVDPVDPGGDAIDPCDPGGETVDAVDAVDDADLDPGGEAVDAVDLDGPQRALAKRSYAFIGLGAVGGYYGARLLAAGHAVHFLARSDADHVREHGLRVDSPFGDLRLDDISVFTSAEDVPPVDVVVVAVKTTTDPNQIAELLVPLVRDDTVVLVLQNGLGIEAPIARSVPFATVVGGMCFICSNKVGPGHIRHLDYGAVTVGEHSESADGAGITPAVDAIVTDLEAAGLPAQRIENLVTGRWRKLVWNIAYNGLSVVLDAGTDELMRDTRTRALVRDLMDEVVAAAYACGHPVDPGFVDTMMTTTDDMTPYKTSMKLDYEARRPLEIDTIYGAPIMAAHAMGFDMVRTRTLYAQLQFLDTRNRLT